MSAKHPIIAVTGSSGAGTTTTSEAFRKMFSMMDIKPAWVEGDQLSSLYTTRNGYRDPQSQRAR